MIRIFYKDGHNIRRETDVREIAHIQNVIWVDLHAPSQEEEEWIETKCDVSFQTPQEIIEIESSARFFEQNNTLYANSNFLRVDGEELNTYPISFILSNHTLFTYRTTDSKTFGDTVRKMKLGQELFNDGADVLLMLLETRIETDADVIEAFSRDISAISREMSKEQKAEQDILLRINTLMENTMMLRETIIDKQRVQSAMLRSSFFPEDRKERLRIILKDIGSLLEYSAFNFERLEYLQNTFMGLINLEQNQIIKIFTVVTIVFMPPTLIAGIFGMNYQSLPTSQWQFGFWAAILLMVCSSTGMIFYFRRKGWV